MNNFPLITLEYVPSDEEIIIASDVLAMKSAAPNLHYHGAIACDPSWAPKSPISGRGHARVIYWRKLRREARLRQTPARRVKNRNYQTALRMRRGGNVLVFREHKYWPLYVTFLGPVMDRRLYIVQNMKTGETKKFKAPKYLFDALREKYPGDGYVGRSFAIMPDRLIELEEVTVLRKTQ